MQLRSSHKRSELTLSDTEKPNSPLTIEDSLKGDKILLFQESVQPKEVALSRPNVLFEIAAKEITSSNNRHSLDATIASSMASKREAKVPEFNLKNENMALAGWNTSTSDLQAWSNTLLCASAFKIVKSNEERLAYLYTKICEENWINRPPIKSSIENKISLDQPINQAEDSPDNKSLSNFNLISQIPTSLKRFKRSAPESHSEETEIFECKHCELIFGTGQALGGHMSRKHSGKSLKYNRKKDVRAKREYERMKLYVAKKKYFEDIGYNYEEMMQNVGGKMKAKSLINRSQIKKIKATLTEREVYANFK